MRRSVVCLATIIGLVLLAWVYSVHKRVPLFREMLEHDYRPRQTALTLAIADNWVNESPWRHAFIMVVLPPSVERPLVTDRAPYVRYPCGSPLPVYLLARLSGRPPSPAMALGVNLAIQGAVALLLTWLVWYVLGRAAMPMPARAGGALYAGLFYALSGLTMVYHAADYFCTETLPFWLVLVALLESVRLAGQGRRAADAGLALALFGGCMTDWFVYLVGAGVLLNRWLAHRAAGESRRSARAWLPAALWVVLPMLVALGIVAYQVDRVGQWQVLWLKFLQRTGADASLTGYPGVSLLKGFYHRALGLPATFFVWSSALLVAGMYGNLVRRGLGTESTRRATHLLGTAFLLFFPCLLHAHVLSEHTRVHQDAVLKFAAVLAAVPFVLLPAGFCAWLAARFTRLHVEGVEDPTRPAATRDWDLLAPVSQTVFCLVCVVLGGCLCLIPSHADWRGPLPTSVGIKVRDPVLGALRSLRAQATYDEVFFSPSIEVTDSYDELPVMTIARKNVYRVESAAALLNHPVLEVCRRKGSTPTLRLITLATDDAAAVARTFAPLLGDLRYADSACRIWDVRPPAALP